MTLIENIANEISKITNLPIRAHRIDPRLNEQIAIFLGGGRQIKGMQGHLRYKIIQIQVMHKDLRTAESLIENIVDLLDSSRNLGVEGVNWNGAIHSWESENDSHVFMTEFTLIM